MMTLDPVIPNEAVKSVVRNVAEITADIGDDNMRAAVILAMAIQSVYCIAIELENQSKETTATSLRASIRLLLNALTIVDPLAAYSPKRETMN